MRRFSVLAIAAATVALVPAASASAATKTIPVKVDLSGIVLFTDDLGGALESKSARCVKSRTVKLSGAFADQDETDAAGSFQFEEGNMYEPGEWTVKVPESAKFGRPGHRKQCAADSANYTYEPVVPWTITFTIAPSGGSGTVTNADPACDPIALDLYRDNSYVASTGAASDGSYSFGSENFTQSGSYQVRGPGTVVPDDKANGDFRYAECLGSSPTRVVSN